MVIPIPPLLIHILPSTPAFFLLKYWQFVPVCFHESQGLHPTVFTFGQISLRWRDRKWNRASLRGTMKDSLFVLYFFLDWKGSCGLSWWFVMPGWKLILSEAPTLTFRWTRESRVEGIGCSCMLVPHQSRLKARNPAQTFIYWEPRTGQRAGTKLHLVSVFVFHLSPSML